MKKINFIGCCIALFLSVTAHAADDVPEDEIKVQVLENVSYEGCPYSDKVTLEVKFSIISASSGHLNLKTSLDGITFNQQDVITIEGQRGSHLFTFEAGECLQAFQVQFEH